MQCQIVLVELLASGSLIIVYLADTDGCAEATKAIHYELHMFIKQLF